jgi:hypothetical protein
MLCLLCFSYDTVLHNTVCVTAEMWLLPCCIQLFQAISTAICTSTKLGAVLEYFWYKKVQFWVWTLLNLDPNCPEPEPMVRFEVQLISWMEPEVQFQVQQNL